ncbi:MAG: putative manganese-dependent inorganic diphosphatase [Clostridia bacterium]|nr:putative manganese-dependent inorganic diphosphatase [Lachnospiraceae bacterium]NCB99628.1 putative manganese-dependent inorganic diphosphatase [Clostridia bacterium]NCD01832.1 putative manganese-dependent inorganic diphosphatase [Clostridia bacterium]
MEVKGQKEIYIIGHKNPDTDSICSAIAYAALKNEIREKIHQGGSVESYQDVLIDGENIESTVYVPARAGQINTETNYVLKKFHQKAPTYMIAIRTQVADINIRRNKGISADASLKTAWETMRLKETSTLAVTDSRGKLKGLITISDIAGAYMSVLNNQILAEACTPIENILETLKGELIVGDSKKRLTKGKLVVSTANLEVIDEFIKKDDLVILGNRYEAQLSAIENQASCIIICDGAKASRTICKLAEEKDCVIICTPYDTYTVTRSINQSIPVSYFMIKDGLIAFAEEDYVADIKPTMMNKRHRDFPIVDKNDKYIGMISRRTLIDMHTKQVILVDHNEVSQAADGVDEAEVMEIIDHHKLGTVETIRPVKVRNEPVGCTATIIYEMYMENQIEVSKDIAGILCAAILSDTLMFRSPTCTPVDKMAAEQLADIAGLDIENFAMKMFEEGSQLQKKTDSEIFFQDYKKFVAGDIPYAVGQITSMNHNELLEIQERLLAYMETVRNETEMPMIFFMLTDILQESTRLLFVGNEAKIHIENGFQVVPEEHYVDLKGVVSRKKQLIPKLTAVLQQ